MSDTLDAKPTVLPDQRTEGLRRKRNGFARVGNRALPVVFIVLLIVLWEVYARLSDVPTYILPAPSAIIARLASDYELLVFTHATATLTSIAIGYVIGTTFGFLIAGVMFYLEPVRHTLYPLIVGAQTIPKVAIAPLLVLWMGYGLQPQIVIVALMCFFPITITTLQGLSAVDQNLIDLFRSVDAGRLKILYRIRIPSALPQVMSGMKIAMTLAVVGAVVAEWVGSAAGLGYLLILANTQLDAPLLFSSLLLLTVIGVGLFLLVALMERLILPWRHEDEGKKA